MVKPRSSSIRFPSASRFDQTLQAERQTTRQRTTFLWERLAQTVGLDGLRFPEGDWFAASDAVYKSSARIVASRDPEQSEESQTLSSKRLRQPARDQS